MAQLIKIDGTTEEIGIGDGYCDTNKIATPGITISKKQVDEVFEKLEEKGLFLYEFFENLKYVDFDNPEEGMGYNFNIITKPEHYNYFIIISKQKMIPLEVNGNKLYDREGFGVLHPIFISLDGTITNNWNLIGDSGWKEKNYTYYGVGSVRKDDLVKVSYECKREMAYRIIDLEYFGNLFPELKNNE